MKRLLLLLAAASALVAPAVEVTVFPGEYAGSAANVIVETHPTYGASERWTVKNQNGRLPHRLVVDADVADTNINFVAWLDENGDGSYTVGEPFGVSNGRHPPSIGLTRTSAIMPRFDLANNTCDRASDPQMTLAENLVYAGTTGINNPAVKLNTSAFQGQRLRLRIMRWSIDNCSMKAVSVNYKCLLDKTFDTAVSPHMHEGDILSDDMPDLEWNTFSTDVAAASGVAGKNLPVMSMKYLVVLGVDFGSQSAQFDNMNMDTNLANSTSTNTTVTAHSFVIERRFEQTRHAPTAVSGRISPSGTAFTFRIDNEDAFASHFGTSYTSCKIVVKNGSTTLWNSGVVRLPPRNPDGSFTYNTSATAGSNNTAFATNHTWQVFIYNAKFKSDAEGSTAQNLTE